MASTTPKQCQTMLRSSAQAHTSMKPISPLISSMVDNTAYVPASTRSPSIRDGTNTSDGQVATDFTTSTTVLTPNTVNIGQPYLTRQADNISFQKHVTTTISVGGVASRDQQDVQQNDTLATGTPNVAAPLSDILPKVTGSSFDNSRAIAPTPSLSPTQSHQRNPLTYPDRKIANAKSRTAPSLYPHPSTTTPSSDLPSSSIVRKRSRTARSDHPERFLYAGNTFSNLDDGAFHDTAESNPYLSQLTSNASRPVYKSPLEARLALKEADKPAVAPIDYDQQIKQLREMIANFRKKYEKSKVMTVQAGIEVEGNVWDRLSNMVQYPPDFDAYAKKEQGDLGDYAEEMKGWDKAIGHQVIIKKRIVYKEAIEKLQVKLDILLAEKGLDTHNKQLKRKVVEIAEEEVQNQG